MITDLADEDDTLSEREGLGQMLLGDNDEADNLDHVGDLVE